ncbi:MAG: MBL fold metallo-hydrolase [Bacteroidetes bacterium]|nr:MBL fold metallo-hydrolase [Bacteroidota bacterium]
MKIFKKQSVLLTVLLFCLHFAFGQTGEIKIKFIGNCGLYMTDGNLNIYVDFPYKSGAHHYMKYNKSEIDSIKDNSIFIFTHRHSDHYSRKLIRNPKGNIYGPWRVSKKRKLDLEKLNNSINEFSLQSFKTSHIFSLHHSSYLITWHNKKIFISGDTGDVGPISKIKNMDWVFGPFWIYSNAMQQKKPIDSKMIGIFHLYPDQKIGEGFPGNIHFFTQQNEVISIPF